MKHENKIKSYTRMFLPDDAGDYEATRVLHNMQLGLIAEDSDIQTATAVRLGKNGKIWP